MGVKSVVVEEEAEGGRREWGKPACLIIRLLFLFAFDSLFVKLNKNINKYYDGNAVL